MEIPRAAWLFPHRPWGLLGTGPKRLTMGTQPGFFLFASAPGAGRLLRGAGVCWGQGGSARPRGSAEWL